MDTSTLKKNYSTIRFRRWTRKNYAVFAGLHREISIGHISFDICEKALLKSGKKTQDTYFETDTDDSTEEEEDFTDLLILKELSEQQYTVNSPAVFITDRHLINIYNS